MSDVQIPSFGWKKLKKSANCYLPALIEISAGGELGFSNAELHRAAQAAGIKGLSQHIIGKIMDLNAVTHDTAQKVVLAYAQLRADSAATRPAITDDDIVGALLVVPDLQRFMQQAGINADTLAAKSGVSKGAIAYAAKGQRVPGGAVCALHAALKPASDLASFATSDPGKGAGTVIGKPFTHDDLLLPVAADAPSPWQ